MYNIIVTEDIQYTVDGVEKTYATVVEVKSLNSRITGSNIIAIDPYDPTNLNKIYIDGKFYDKAEDVPT